MVSGPWPERSLICRRENPLSKPTVRISFGFSSFRGRPAATIALAGLLWALPAGCSNSPFDSGWSTGTKVTAIADWDDVDAAVSAASSKLALSPESTVEVDEGTQRYRLLTVADQPVDLEIVRGIGSSASMSGPRKRLGPTSMTIQCRFGRFGDERKEKQFVDAIRVRLGDLTGVDYAPLR